MKKILVLISITFLILQACSSNNSDNNPIQINLPQLGTTSVSNITQTSANIGGSVIANGGGEITERGVVWSTSPNPTISLNTRTVVGAGLGIFSSLITGLNAGTTYYARTYAINSKGTNYSNEITFVASPLPILVHLTTAGFHSITTNSAVCSVTDILNSSGLPITSRGVVWSTNPNPTILLSTKTSEGTGEINFSSTITGLNVTTTYYVRAYATNSLGTFYGNEISFKTIAVYSYVQGPTVNDIDGNSYPTIITNCNNQTWTTKNLNVSHYKNGDVIPQITDIYSWNRATTGAWCYYQNNSANGVVYGKLYNCYAVNDPRGLAPSGYHVATGAEWGAFVDCLGGTILAGGKMKESGTSHWVSPNTDATNSSGFNALPGGSRNELGNFTPTAHIGREGHWWPATGNNTIPTSPMHYNLNYNDGWAVVHYDYLARGYSVRCVKD